MRECFYPKLTNLANVPQNPNWQRCPYPDVSKNCNQKSSQKVQLTRFPNSTESDFICGILPPKFNSSPLNKRWEGKTILSYWVLVTFQWRTVKLRGGTLPKTNIAPENKPSQKEIHLPPIHSQGLCETSGGYLFNDQNFVVNHHHCPGVKWPRSNSSGFVYIHQKLNGTLPRDPVQ